VPREIDEHSQTRRMELEQLDASFWATIHQAIDHGIAANTWCQTGQLITPRPGVLDALSESLAKKWNSLPGMTPDKLITELASCQTTGLAFILLVLDSHLEDTDMYLYLDRQHDVNGKNYAHEPRYPVGVVPLSSLLGICDQPNPITSTSEHLGIKTQLAWLQEPKTRVVVGFQNLTPSGDAHRFFKRLIKKLETIFKNNQVQSAKAYVYQLNALSVLFNHASSTLNTSSSPRVFRLVDSKSAGDCSSSPPSMFRVKRPKLTETMMALAAPSSGAMKTEQATLFDISWVQFCQMYPAFKPCGIKSACFKAPSLSNKISLQIRRKHLVPFLIDDWKDLDYEAHVMPYLSEFDTNLHPLDQTILELHRLFGRFWRKICDLPAVPVVFPNLRDASIQGEIRWCAANNESPSDFALYIIRSTLTSVMDLGLQLARQIVSCEEWLMRSRLVEFPIWIGAARQLCHPKSLQLYAQVAEVVDVLNVDQTYADWNLFLERNVPEHILAANEIFQSWKPSHYLARATKDSSEFVPGLLQSRGLEDLLNFIDASVSHGRHLLIHCYAGRHRSVSILMMWLLIRQRWSVERIFKSVIRLERCVSLQPKTLLWMNDYALKNQIQPWSMVHLARSTSMSDDDSGLQQVFDSVRAMEAAQKQFLAPSERV